MSLDGTVTPLAGDEAGDAPVPGELVTTIEALRALAEDLRDEDWVEQDVAVLVEGLGVPCQHETAPPKCSVGTGCVP